MTQLSRTASCEGNPIMNDDKWGAAMNPNLETSDQVLEFARNLQVRYSDEQIRSLLDRALASIEDQRRRAQDAHAMEAKLQSEAEHILALESSFDPMHPKPFSRCEPFAPTPRGAILRALRRGVEIADARNASGTQTKTRHPHG